MAADDSKVPEGKAGHPIKLESDDLDTQILSCLTDNARESARSLAMRLKVSPATVVSRIKRLEHVGAIRGYSALLDYPRLGYDYVALTEVTAVKGRLFDAMKAICKLAGVVSVYEVTGLFDFMVLSRCRTRVEFGKLLHSMSSLEEVSHTNTHVVFNTMMEDHRSYPDLPERAVKSLEAAGRI